MFKTLRTLDRQIMISARNAYRSAVPWRIRVRVPAALSAAAITAGFASVPFLLIACA